MFDDLADDYDQSDVSYFARFGADLVRRAGVAAGDRVLDVGSGRGAVLLPAADAVGSNGHVTGIDLSERMVQVLREELLERRVDNADVRVGDAEVPPVDDGAFDAVLASLVLFFVPDPARAIVATHRALRSEGVLAFTTFGPLSDRWQAVYDVVMPLAPKAGRPRPGHGSPLWDDPAAIAQLVASCGFTDIQVDEETFDIRFESPQHWFDWSWTVGTRALWMSMDEPTRQLAKAAALDVVGSFADEDGSIVLPEVLRFTIGRRSN